MAKAKSILIVVLLAAAIFTVACSTVAVRPTQLIESSRLRPWLPPPAPRAVVSPVLEPPPVLLALAAPPERDATQLLLQSQHSSLANVRRDESDALLEQFRAKEVEAWKQTQSTVTQQPEPMILEDLLRLNIQEDSRVSPDLQRTLLATKSDLPLSLNERVSRYLNYFLGRGRNTLLVSLRRSGSYRPMISRILAEEGVPQDMIYLVQAESGFRPQARSSKRATGMWQFVAWRGREYGLNQNRHVDERLDPEKATRAAAHHLADLYAQFGNWYLAMAAYNCGPGCVQRAVERTGYADYWELVRRGVLPRETTNYVPVILAMALVAKNADHFHLGDVVPESPIHYDTVQTNSRIGLRLIADATGTTAERIKQLNPALLGQSTPDGPYALRIPKDTTERFHSEIAAVPEARRLSWRRHEVQPNETVSQIAAQYKVKIQDVLAVNHLETAGPAPGDRLTIPVPYRPEVVRAAYSPASGRTHLVHYRVRSGDSLGSIARRHRVSVAQLQQWNGLHGTKLQVGQVLNVRTTTSSPSQAAPRRASPPPSRASLAGGTSLAVAGN